MVVFMIVGKNEPLFEIELGSTGRDDLAYLHQFILHSSLDMIDNTMWVNGSTFLRVIDKFNNLMVSAYVTPGGAYLLLLHDGKNEDAVRSFMVEVHEIYVKHILNPFVLPDSPICSSAFDSHVRAASRRILSL